MTDLFTAAIYAERAAVKAALERAERRTDTRAVKCLRKQLRDATTAALRVECGMPAVIVIRGQG